MRTPAGKECRFYYEDFHRGRNVQECRLVKENPLSEHWHPSDCAKCPIPEILNANSSPNMELRLTIKSSFLGLRRQLEVNASCTLHHLQIADPFVGCPKCNENRPGLDVFRRALEQIDDD